MKEFLWLNRHKLGFTFKSTSIIFLMLSITILSIGYFNNQTPEIFLVIIILLTSGIGFPIFILFIGFLEWISERRLRVKVLSNPPFNELEKIDFYKSLIKEQSKWYFTEETKEGFINGFKIECNVNRDKPNIIEFKAITKPRQFNKNEFSELLDRLKRNNIELEWGGLCKTYDVRRLSIKTLQHLKSDLEQFTKILEQERFEPEM